MMIMMMIGVCARRTTLGVWGRSGPMTSGPARSLARHAVHACARLCTPVHAPLMKLQAATAVALSLRVVQVSAPSLG